MVPWGSLAPLMITRLIVSLKKAVKPQDSIWSAGRLASVRFARYSIGGSERGDGVALGDLSSEGESSLSRSDGRS